MTLENVEGVDGKLKVWIRRVWTLEMVCVTRDCEGMMMRVERWERQMTGSSIPSTPSTPRTRSSRSATPSRGREDGNWIEE
jgi:hypothetical protein